MRAFLILTFASLVLTIALVLAIPSLADSTAPAAGAASPLERIRAGEINCRHCNLAGADLTNQCVKNGDLSAAVLDGANAAYMCMSHALFAGASFRGANLTGANLGHSDLTGADLTDANLTITSLKGADLSRAIGLTQGQLDHACSDSETRVPAGLTAKPCT